MIEEQKFNYNDIIGKRFNRLTAIKCIDYRKDSQGQGRYYYLCKCDCGKTKIARRYNLRSGRTKSCGCHVKEYNFHPNFNPKDIVGQKFGRLTVLEYSHAERRKTWKQKACYHFYKCECDCGNITWASRPQLKQGRKKSCGCILLHHDWFPSRLPKGEAVFNRIFRSYKSHAKNKGIKFSLTKNQFRLLTKQNCYYCGVPPSQTYEKEVYNGGYTYNGIDRLESDKGYILENCVTCCIKCNRAKHVMSEQEFKDWINRVYHHINNQV